MAIQKLENVVTVRLNRAGFDPQTGRPTYQRELIRFSEFRQGDIVNVPKANGAAADVLEYIAAKLGLSTDRLSVSEYGSYWAIRHVVGETI